MPNTSSDAMALGKAKSSSEDDQEALAIEHICFLELESKNGKVLWPALLFDNFFVMKAFLERRGLLDQPLRAAITAQFTSRMIKLKSSSAGGDRVALLLGTSNPTGRRCVFRPTGELDFYTRLGDVVEEANKEQREALNMMEAIIRADEVVSSNVNRPESGDEQTGFVASDTDQSVASEEESPEKPKAACGQQKKAPGQPKTSNKNAPADASQSVDDTHSAADTDQSVTTEEESPEKPRATRTRGQQKKASAPSKASTKDEAADSVAETSFVEKYKPTTASEQEEKPQRGRAQSKKAKAMKPKAAKGKAVKAKGK